MHVEREDTEDESSGDEGTGANVIIAKPAKKPLEAPEPSVPPQAPEATETRMPKKGILKVMTQKCASGCRHDGNVPCNKGNALSTPEIFKLCKS